MNAIILGTAMQLAVAVPAHASSFFDEWRFPDARDVIGDWRDFRREGREFYTVAADFDGDGRQDEAWILIKKDGSEWGLFVILDAQGGARQIVELGRADMKIDPPQRMGLGLVPPGYYESACAKGYGSGCQPGERQFVDLKHPAIDFFVFESANSYFFWNDDTDSFERMWISD